jgi:hypothetical protein
VGSKPLCHLAFARSNTAGEANEIGSNRFHP